jgi:hypothetical protein
MKRLNGLGLVSDGESVVVGLSSPGSLGNILFSLFRDLGAAWIMDYQCGK